MPAFGLPSRWACPPGRLVGGRARLAGRRARLARATHERALCWDIRIAGIGAEGGLPPRDTHGWVAISVEVSAGSCNTTHILAVGQGFPQCCMRAKLARGRVFSGLPAVVKFVIFYEKVESRQANLKACFYCRRVLL